MHALHKEGLDNKFAIEGTELVNDARNVVIGGRTIHAVDVVIGNGVEFQDIVVHLTERLHHLWAM